MFVPAALPRLLWLLQDGGYLLDGAAVPQTNLEPWLEDCQDYFEVQGVHILVLQTPSNVWHWCRPVAETADSITVVWPGKEFQPTQQGCLPSPYLKLQTCSFARRIIR